MNIDEAFVETVTPMNIDALHAEFTALVAKGDVEIYNEFSLQHEFGSFLRQKSALANFKVQFERPASYFFESARTRFCKKEIDLAVFAPETTDLLCAFEFKYPRNGQHPVQMFSFVRDVAFLEQLKRNGFGKAFFIAFAEDHLFWEGQTRDGIYRYFRGAHPEVLHGEVEYNGETLKIDGNYRFAWQPVGHTGLRQLIVDVSG